MGREGDSYRMIHRIRKLRAPRNSAPSCGEEGGVSKHLSTHISQKEIHAHIGVWAHHSI